ncbi:MAG: helix-turn-helix transcriptional regulator [Actinobacteria bacterium]|nr:helix-turn-helix transcriptional regulator [Actinomycetota bacterium]
MGEPAAGAAGLAARLAVRLDHARDGVGLTRREWEVFELLGRDASCRQIAAELHVTVSTVRNHVHNMRVRLGLDTREELIALAHEVRDRRAAL